MRWRYNYMFWNIPGLGQNANTLSDRLVLHLELVHVLYQYYRPLQVWLLTQWSVIMLNKLVVYLDVFVSFFRQVPLQVWWLKWSVIDQDQVLSKKSVIYVDYNVPSLVELRLVIDQVHALVVYLQIFFPL